MQKFALISVFDKTGVVQFAKSLCEMGYKIISTGGTSVELSQNGIEVINVSDITGFPECLGGRVKTLHPAIHAGILAMRDNSEHMSQLEKLNINTIDVVAVNLYPFKDTIKKDGVTLEDAIENIDIGGPTMLRSAAKNYRDVAVVVNPSDYNSVTQNLLAGGLSESFRLELAQKVFEHTCHYDTLISTYLAQKCNKNNFSDTFTITYKKAQDLRYGENPHQSAVFYKDIVVPKNSIASAVQIHGKELSFNNINDANGALELLHEFDIPTVVACKHANPCGVGSGATIVGAYKKAFDADPVSIFGGIVAANREIDAETAAVMTETFLEIIIAPSFSADALEILTKKKNIRLLTLEGINCASLKNILDLKNVSGGLLVQQTDDILLDMGSINSVTDVKPTAEQLADLMFAWKVVKHTKSNAIVLAKDGQTVGVGPGQLNRVTALGIAISNAGDRSAGSVMASDAFFPFSDCVEAAAKAGVAAIIQPGGSVRDQESIDACNKHKIAMIFCGVRHFKH